MTGTVRAEDVDVMMIGPDTGVTGCFTTAAGQTVAMIGDTDGDGTDDFLVGDYRDCSATGGGAAYLITGSQFR